MEKRAIIDENTPPEKGPAVIKTDAKEPLTKEAADNLEAHPVKRLSDAARPDAAPPGRRKPAPSC